MTAAFTIEPRGPFSLAQARGFLGSFRPAGKRTDGDGFDLALEGAVVRLREDGEGAHGSVVAGAGREDLEAQVTRILSLDHDATSWADLGERDPVLGELQPEAVLELEELPLPSVKAVRVRGVAQAALDGELDADRLRGMDPEDAMAAVRELPGIGPFSSALIVIRGAGAADAPATFEPRVRAATAERYGDPTLAEPDAFAAFAERWRPWRSWAAFLLRAA